MNLITIGDLLKNHNKVKTMLATSPSPASTPVPETSHPKGVTIEKITTFARQQKLGEIQDAVKRLEYMLEQNPRDTAMWSELISRVQLQEGAANPEAVRKVYEGFLDKFPGRGDVYLGYIKYELGRKEIERVEALFEQCLTRCYDMGLWGAYIDYVREKNNIITGGQEARQVVILSYDVALRSVGIDLDAGDMWVSYLSFVDEWNPISTWEVQQKIELKRRIFKQAVVIPTHKLEELWALYTAFENEQSSVNARKHISDVSLQYIAARTWYKEFTNMTKSMVVNANGKEQSLVDLYKVWINLEKHNKLQLNEKALNTRIEYSYVKSVQKFPFYPQLWFDYVEFKLKDSSSNVFYKEEHYNIGVNLLNEALEYCPYSTLLTYLLAEIYELQNEPSLVTKTFDALIDRFLNQYEQLLLDEQYLETELAKPVYGETQKNNNNDDDEEDQEQVVENPLDCITRELVDRYTLYVKNIQTNKLKLERLITAIYINYIKVAKRAIKKSNSRTIFKEARKRFKNLTWHIYYEEALFEYHTSSNQQNGVKIALKIFDTGMKNLDLHHYKNFPFLVKYFKFLILINDYTNIKSLFEICIKNLTAETDQKHTFQRESTLKALFKLLFRYELYNNNLLSLQTLKQRYNDIFPTDSSLHVFSQPFKEYDGLNLIQEFDVNINSNILFNSWTDYETNINDILYTVENNTLPKDIRNKIKQEHLLDSYSSDDENTDFDLQNYGFKSKSSKPDLKRPYEPSSPEDSDVQDDDYDPSVLDDVSLFSGKDIDDGKPFVSDNIYNLLRVLPNANSFDKKIFDSHKLVNLLRELNIP